MVRDILLKEFDLGDAAAYVISPTMICVERDSGELNFVYSECVGDLVVNERSFGSKLEEIVLRNCD